MGSYSRLTLIVLTLFVFASCSRQRYAYIPKAKGESHKSAVPERQKNRAAVPEEKVVDEQAVMPYAPEEKQEEKDNKSQYHAEKKAQRQLRIRELKEKIPNPQAINRILREEIKKVPGNIFKDEEKKEEKKTQWAGAFLLGLLLIIAGALLGVAGSASLGYLLGSLGFVLIIIGLVLLVLGGS